MSSKTTLVEQQEKAAKRHSREQVLRGLLANPNADPKKVPHWQAELRGLRRQFVKTMKMAWHFRRGRFE